MPKKKNTNSDSFRFADGLVSAVCLAGALACLVFFYRDLTTTLSRLGEQSVGTISWKYKAAQRRFTDRVLWDRLRMNAPVYNGDLIRTASLSEASVTFSGGGIIELAENSLVRISAYAAVSRIDLVEGTAAASAAGEGGMILAAGEYELALDPGGTAVSSFGEEGADFLVTGGGASLSGDSGLLRELGAGDALGFRPGGSEETEPRAVVVSPPANVRLLSSGSSALAVDFAWNRVNYGPGDITRVDIARDRGFTRPVFSRNVPAGESRSRAELSPGVYYWRVYAGPENGGVVHASKLTILRGSPPGPVSPAAEQSYRHYPGGRPLRFRWTHPGGPDRTLELSPDSYLLEAADNPELSDPVVRIQTRMTHAESPLLGPGRWFWRVSARYGDVFLASGVIPFTIEQGGELDPPVLVMPAAESEVDLRDDQRSLYFSWKAVPGADFYTLRVSSGRDMSNPVIAQRVTGNYYAYPAGSRLREGEYYWDVSAAGGGGRASVSPVRSFTARRTPPDIRIVFPPDNYTVGEDALPDVRFTWKTGVSPVRFQIAGDPGFTGPVVDEQSGGTTFQGRRLPAGTWYWRVVSGALQSPVRRFTVAGALPPPVLSGETGELLLRPGENAVFRWQAVEGADYYRFRLYDGGGGLLSEQTLRDTSAGVAMDGRPEGTYRWTVQSFAEAGQQGSRRSGLTGTALFYFSGSPEADSGLEGISPGNNVTFGTVQFRDRPFIVFTWTELAEAADYTLVLSAGDGRQVLSRTVSRPPYILDDLSVLSRGVFSWQVQANLGSGQTLFPERGFVIDIPAVGQSRLQDVGTLYGTE
jgi:hypothetical protein